MTIYKKIYKDDGNSKEIKTVFLTLKYVKKSLLDHKKKKNENAKCSFHETPVKPIGNAKTTTVITSHATAVFAH